MTIVNLDCGRYKQAGPNAGWACGTSMRPQQSFTFVSFTTGASGASILFGFLHALLCVFSAKVLAASFSFWIGRFESLTTFLLSIYLLCVDNCTRLICCLRIVFKKRIDLDSDSSLFHRNSMIRCYKTTLSLVYVVVFVKFKL